MSFWSSTPSNYAIVYLGKNQRIIDFEECVRREKTSNVGDYTYSFTYFANYVVNMMFPT